LPVGVTEATAWLERGGHVQVFCEAVPWPEEPAAGNAMAVYKRRRSFAASSGQLPIRVIVSFMATFEGACPNLLPDMRCGIYEQRPRACRVYPAEVNPFIRLDPVGKLCPPEAWRSDDILQDDDGTWVDPEVADAIHGMREADSRDASLKARVCSALQLTMAGLSNEGVVIHEPGRARLMDALKEAAMASEEGVHAPPGCWTFVSHRPATLALLESASSAHVAASSLREPGARFLNFLPAEM
jgi:hypothetical protein